MRLAERLPGRFWHDSHKAVRGRRAWQRWRWEIDQDIQILPEVVLGLDRIAAVAVDKRRQISYQGINDILKRRIVFSWTIPLILI